MKNILTLINYKLPGGGYLSKYPLDNVFIVSQKRIEFSGSILFVVSKEVL